MITTVEDYYGLLYKVQDQNPPNTAIRLPSDEPVYEIDLDSRTVEAPDFVSVSKDHYSEIIYFKCPRYFDNVDLSTTVGIVEYVNAKGEAFFYPIPFYDTETFGTYNPGTKEEEPYILFPWAVDGGATAAAGTLTFAIRFYKLSEGGDKIIYNLNTLPSTTKVLQGLNSELDYRDYDDTVGSYAETVLQYLKQASDIGVYWLDV